MTGHRKSKEICGFRFLNWGWDGLIFKFSCLPFFFFSVFNVFFFVSQIRLFDFFFCCFRFESDFLKATEAISYKFISLLLLLCSLMLLHMDVHCFLLDKFVYKCMLKQLLPNFGHLGCFGKFVDIGYKVN